jgi:hypothetical protein
VQAKTDGRTSLIVLATLLFVSAPRAQKNEPSLKDVLRRLTGYVQAYGEKVSIIVATERYTQEYVSNRRNGQHRVSVAEFAIVKTDGPGWIGYRDVLEVDGQRVSDREDRLVNLLTSASGGADDARRLSDESARFNIGPVLRNFNVPTTALFFFTPENTDRFSFKRAGDGPDGTWEIGFKETGRPTFIHTPEGKPVPARGSLWVNPRDGTIVHSQLKLTAYAPSEDVTFRTLLVVDVVYQLVDAIGMWLPTTMTEIYDGTNGSDSDHITTRAEYSNYRQFKTSARIK